MATSTSTDKGEGMSVRGNIDLAGRMERLERANRRLVGGVVMLALGSACLVAIGAAAPAPKSIETQELVIKDAAGKIRVTFGMAGTDEFGFMIRTPEDRGRAYLSILKDGSVGMYLGHGKHKAMAGIGVGDNGKPFIQLVDREGHPAFTAP
jgi:hypothetical protein